MTLIHPVVRKLFTEKIPNVPLAGRLSEFVKQWEKITRDQEILLIVNGVLDTIQKFPSSEASKHNKIVRTTIPASGPGNIKVAGEESYSESRNSF